jgi:hypothetical protein
MVSKLGVKVLSAQRCMGVSGGSEVLAGGGDALVRVAGTIVQI